MWVWGRGRGEGARLGGTQRGRQLHGDVVVAAGSAATRAGGGVTAHHHAAPHHLQPAPCNTAIYVSIHVLP
ncbi:jg18467 [Pararge aegeria aegeria]|uniref:Jg18467 protein n=1 Tax=Pararge aegeria aegeria TaxID=348720 RepID=A0A8S4RMQ7_9NEOP|nr:jg18467 [Pararge aegeria aegeria]